MGKIPWVLVVACVLGQVGAAAAQSVGVVQGSVTDVATGRPLAGAQVAVQGAGSSAVTAVDGRYRITGVPAGERVIRASVLGYGTSDVRVRVGGGATVTADFALSPAAVALDGLVVTALGIERRERELTTSVQEVSGEQLTRTRESNLVAALSGKVAGVTIHNSNTAGGSSRVVIRGASSLTGNNQPLFVVDGIPVSNASGGGGRMGYNAIDYGNAVQDLNPENVESISVLKGPNAAALYGSRAANGAIIITTKRGRSGTTSISASTQVTFETPLKLPEYQNLYGQGFSGRYSYVNGKGSGVNDDADESWGPRLDGAMIPQFFSNGQAVPWVAHPNNVRDFFETGRTSNTSVAFTTGTESADVRLSLSNLHENGMYPGYVQDRTTAALNGAARLSDRLDVDGSVQYINIEADNRPAQGYGADNFMWQFLWFGRQVDTRLLRARLRNEDGSQFNWNNRWNNNPYWTALENTNEDGRDRLIGSGSLQYRIAPWLRGALRSGTDLYSENRVRRYAAGSIGSSSVDANGAFGETDIFRQEVNTDLLLSAEWPRMGDLSLSGNAGAARRDNLYRSSSSYTRSLVVPGVYNLANAAVTPSFDQWRERQRVNSLYGQMHLGFRDFLFVDVTGRNDWSSTLPAGNNSYFYPSVSAGLVFSEVADVPALSFGRLRASWAEVGNDADPYQLIDPYVADAPFGGIPRYTASNRLRNFDLKPENTRAWEIGTDLRFFLNRVAIEVTYFDKVTSNQIIPVQITPMTGFTQRMLNAGQISNRGFEAMLDLVPVRLDNGFEWGLTANFTQVNSRVEELYGDLETIVLGTYYGVSVEARKGEPYGQMYGRKYVRDGAGNIVVSATTGRPLNDSKNPNGLLGNYNPDWSGGLSNRLRYGPVELSFLLDTRQGGSIYSLTSAYGRRSGVLIETLQGREKTPTDGLLVPGVTPTGEVNTRRTTAQLYHRGLTGLHEQFVFDASFVKLREMRLGYDVPARYSRGVGLEGLRLALIGRNLALWTDVPHIDPETSFNAGNVQGFEYSQMPSARSVGLSVSVTP